MLKTAPPDELLREQIVRCFSAELTRFARFRCGDDSLGSDAFQESMVSMMQALPSYRGDAPILSWLRRLVVSACSRLRRGRRNDPAFNRPLDEAPEMAEEQRQEMRLMLQERVSLLHLALSEVEEPNRSLLLLHEGEDVSIEALAERHGLSVEGVKSRLKRTRSRIRARLLDLASR
jgi:RNA polymerase sigma-70 factor (ECF subfamily)